METDNQQVYQFKISLKGIKPTIWRRIQVPENYTFWELHVAIQDAMGWYDCHLHSFNILNPQTGRKEEIGIPDEDGELEFLAGWKTQISSYFSLQNKKADYDYDFGDNWEHSLLLEKIIPQNFTQKYPLCIGGERACPPEDCGGIGGYEDLLEIIKNPDYEENDIMIELLGRSFNPEEFQSENVYFDDPNKRWIRAFQDPTL